MGRYSQIVSSWQEVQLRRPGDLDQLLRDFNPLYVYHSSQLEGLTIDWETVAEFFRTGEVSQFSGDPQALFHLYNQRQCYEYLRERVLARDEMDTSLILELHRILTSGFYNRPDYLESGERAGEFKKKDYVTQLNAVGVPAREVRDQLDQLMEEVNGYCGSDLLWEGAYLHARFENIHPFAAGNGSTGRMLLNFFLLTRNHPPLVIFAEDQDQYYQALTAYDEKRNLRPLTALLQDQLGKTWDHLAALH